MISCSSSSSNDVVVKDGYLVSFQGINLTEYDFDVDESEREEMTLNYLLCLAVEECELKLVSQIIEKGGDVNYKCLGADDLITGVGFCEKKNAIKMTQLLLDHGAKINGVDEDNESFLSYAISNDDIEFVDFILSKGAKTNIRDKNKKVGCLPIHSVTSVPMLEFLISKGFKVNETCNNGSNLLHNAIRHNHVELATYLIKNKLVNLKQKDVLGDTPLDFAKGYDQPEIAKLLE